MIIGEWIRKADHTSQASWCCAAITAIAPCNNAAIALEGYKSIVTIGEDLCDICQSYRRITSIIAITPCNDSAIVLEGCKGISIRIDLSNTTQYCR